MFGVLPPPDVNQSAQRKGTSVTLRHSPSSIRLPDWCRTSAPILHSSRTQARSTACGVWSWRGTASGSENAERHAIPRRSNSACPSCVRRRWLYMPWSRLFQGWDATPPSWPPTMVPWGVAHPSTVSRALPRHQRDGSPATHGRQAKMGCTGVFQSPPVMGGRRLGPIDAS